MEFQHSLGARVSIAFETMSDDERERLETARSGKKASPSKVDQGQHQTVAQTGTVVEQRLGADGVSYLVCVDDANLPRGRLRAVIEEDLSAI